MSYGYTGHNGVVMRESLGPTRETQFETSDVSVDVDSITGDVTEVGHQAFYSGGMGARVISETYLFCTMTGAKLTLQIWNHKGLLNLILREGIPAHIEASEKMEHLWSKFLKDMVELDERQAWIDGGCDPDKRPNSI